MATLIRDSLYIGESPWEETCAQVGSDMYLVNARKECQRFIDQIRRHYGDEPVGARLYTKSNPHDFGSYMSVECEFVWDPSEKDQTDLELALISEEWTPSQEYAFAIEGDDKGVLQNWDSDE